MRKKIKITETWRAFLMNRSDLQRVECWKLECGDQYVDPLVAPERVVLFLGLERKGRIQLISADITSIAQLKLVAAATEFYKLLRDDIIEFEVDRWQDAPVIVEADWDVAYQVCGWDEPGGHVDTIYFNVGEGPDGWYLTTGIDTLTSAEDTFIDDGPYEAKERAIVAGVDYALDWHWSSTWNPDRKMSLSTHKELREAVKKNGLDYLFTDDVN